MRVPGLATDRRISSACSNKHCTAHWALWAVSAAELPSQHQHQQPQVQRVALSSLAFLAQPRCQVGRRVPRYVATARSGDFSTPRPLCAVSRRLLGNTNRPLPLRPSFAPRSSSCCVVSTCSLRPAHFVKAPSKSSACCIAAVFPSSRRRIPETPSLFCPPTTGHGPMPRSGPVPRLAWPAGRTVGAFACRDIPRFCPVLFWCCRTG